MNWSSTSGSLVGLVWSLGWLAGVASGAGLDSDAQFTVRLYDYAAVPTRTLAEAERVSSGVFREAGIKLRWVECGRVEKKSGDFDACEHVGDPLRLVLKVVPESMAAQLHRPPRVFGMAVQADSFIFFDRIQEFSANEEISLKGRAATDPADRPRPTLCLVG